MNQKLPGVFQGKVKKNSGNNRQIFYSDRNDDDVVEDAEKNEVFSHGMLGKNINQKINDILNSPSYVYKADVEIKLKDKTINKRIVGRNALSLITIENELIPISDVVDIYLSKK